MKLIERIKWIKDHMKEPKVVISGEEFDEVFDKLEKAEKYKWHDLRKNPEDLPKTLTVRVCIKPVGDYMKLYDDSKYFCGLWQTRHGEFLKNECVIAWREIEPFEEVEE